MFNKNNFWGQNNMMDGCCQSQNMDMNMCDNEREIVEPMVNKCIEREFVHEVPHICPINTHIINKHIYNHTYTPCYTCTEENQVINNDCGNCCGF